LLFSFVDSTFIDIAQSHPSGHC